MAGKKKADKFTKLRMKNRFTGIEAFFSLPTSPIRAWFRGKEGRKLVLVQGAGMNFLIKVKRRYCTHGGILTISQLIEMDLGL